LWPLGGLGEEGKTELRKIAKTLKEKAGNVTPPAVALPYAEPPQR
jgi:hypothetical protein